MSKGKFMNHRFMIAICLTLLVGSIFLWGCSPPELSGGRLHFAQGRFDKAEEQFALGVQKYPKNGIFRLEHGRALAELNRNEEAAAEFAKAVEIAPSLKSDVTNARLHYYADHFNKGLQLQQEKRMDEALKEYQAALMLDPSQTSVYTNIGNVYSQMDRTDEAIEMFKKAAEAAPNDPKMKKNLFVVYHNLAAESFNKGKYPEAIKFYKQALDYEDDPKDVEILFQIANGNFNIAVTTPEGGDSKTPYGEAATYYRKVLEVAPSDTLAMYNLGLTLLNMDDGAGAVDVLQKVVDLDPKNADNHSALGRALGKRQGKDDTARSVTEILLSRALKDQKPVELASWMKDAPGKYGTNSELGRLLKEKGNPEEVYSFDAEGSEVVAVFYWKQGSAEVFTKGGARVGGTTFKAVTG